MSVPNFMAIIPDISLKAKNDDLVMVLEEKSGDHVSRLHPLGIMNVYPSNSG